MNMENENREMHDWNLLLKFQQTLRTIVTKQNTVGWTEMFEIMAVKRLKIVQAIELWYMFGKFLLSKVCFSYFIRYILFELIAVWKTSSTVKN